MSALLSMSPWATPMDVWLEKTGRAEPRTENIKARTGHLNEGTAAILYGEEMALDDAKTMFISSPTLRAPDQKIAVATPDRFVCARKLAVELCTDGAGQYVPSQSHWSVFQSYVENLLECKNVGFRVLPHWRGRTSDEYLCPDYVAIQVYWQMRCCPGIDVGDVAALLGGTDFRSFRFIRDQDMLDEMSEFAEQWWHRHVEADTPPPVDGGSTWKNYVHRLHPEVAERVMLPAEAGASNMAATHIALKAAEKQAKDDYQHLETTLKGLIGKNTGMSGVLPSGKKWQVTWKAPVSGSRSWKEIAAAVARQTTLSDKELLRIIDNNTSAAERKFNLKELR
jgi:predicted phage-related endonuclease